MSFPNRRQILAGAVASALLARIDATHAADWPNRPVTVFVPWPAGGSVDLMSRAVSQRLSTALKQTFVVDNRPGANGNVGAALVARAKPDGNTLMFTSNGPLTNSVLLYKHLSFDPQKDFLPIAVVAETSLIVCANPSVQANGLRDLTEWARKNPGKLKVGNPSNGSVGHLASKLWQFTEGIEITEVPYPGNAPLLAGLMGGVVDVAFDLWSTYVPQLKAGNLKALAVTAEDRLPDAPTVPTVLEQGFKYLVAGGFYGLVAPTGTPDVVTDKVLKVLSDFVQSPEGNAQITQAGLIPKFLGPDDFRKAQVAEVEKWRPIVEKGDIHLN